MNIRIVTNPYYLDKQKLQNSFLCLLANARSAGTKDLFFFFLTGNKYQMQKQILVFVQCEADPFTCQKVKKKKKTNVNYDSYF